MVRMLNDDAFRSSAHGSREVIERLLPEPEVRAVVERILADAITHAHEIGAGSWGVTLYEDKLRLNVGSVESVVLWAGGCHLVVDQALVAQPLKSQLRSSGGWSDAGHYRTYPQGASVYVDSPALAKLYGSLKAAHFSAIEQCAQRRGYNWKGSHSPGVLRYLEARTGVVLPMPSYLGSKCKAKMRLSCSALSSITRTQFRC